MRLMEGVTLFLSFIMPARSDSVRHNRRVQTFNSGLCHHGKIARCAMSVTNSACRCVCVLTKITAS